MFNLKEPGGGGGGGGGVAHKNKYEPLIVILKSELRSVIWAVDMIPYV